jgi:hypothetical protein
MSDIVDRLRADELPGDRQVHREARAMLSALLNEAADEIEKMKASHWRDTEDDLSAAIKSAHPVLIPKEDRESWRWGVYDAAHMAVSNRHGKYELVNLVNWLMVELELAKRKLTMIQIDAMPE